MLSLHQCGFKEHFTILNTHLLLIETSQSLNHKNFMYLIIWNLLKLI
jgi:hypothetical protein